MKQTDYVGLKSEIADPSTPLLVDLHAPWCGYCTRMQPHIDRIAEEKAGSMRFFGMDTDEHPDVFTDLSVRTLPAVILFVDGVEIDRRGSGDYDEISTWLADKGL